MKITDLLQGSVEWLEHRKNTYGASEAATALGINGDGRRRGLLREKITGETNPVTAYQQRIFAEGHATESAARPIIEAQIGEALMTVVGIHDNYPMISASFDGITFNGDVIWEHKLYNGSKNSTQRLELAKKGELKEMDMAQVQQQLLVSGAEKALFTVSDGTAENMATVEVFPDDSWFERLITGWQQFHEEVGNMRQNGTIEDEEAQLLAELYCQQLAAKKAAEEEFKATEAKLKELAAKAGVAIVEIGSIKIETLTRKGAVDYGKIPQLQGVDLEQYRKSDVEYQKISVMK